MDVSTLEHNANVNETKSNKCFGLDVNVDAASNWLHICIAFASHFDIDGNDILYEANDEK